MSPQPDAFDLECERVRARLVDVFHEELHAVEAALKGTTHTPGAIFIGAGGVAIANAVAACIEPGNDHEIADALHACFVHSLQTSRKAIEAGQEPGL